MRSFRFCLSRVALVVAVATATSGCAAPVAEDSDGSGSALSAPPGPCGRINPGQSIDRGGAVQSCNGWFALRVNGDGSVHMFPTWAPHQVLWAIPAHPATRHLAMYGDGNLVLGDDQWRAVPKQDGTPMFVTGAFGAGSFATVTDDGNLFVQSADGVGRWRHH